jgi:hypothetical protein
MAAVVLLFPCINAGAQAPPVADAPDERARVEVNQVWNSLPDFVCSERITSRRLVKGKAREQRVVESVFMALRKKETRDEGSMVYSIVESRELTSVDGKAPKGAQLLTTPFFFDGLAANILFISDTRQYSGAPLADLDGFLRVKIGYTTASSRNVLQLTFPASISGIQIDTQSKTMLHVDSRLVTGDTRGGVPVSADFQRVEIDGNAYWIPRLVTAEIKRGSNETLTYAAEYKDCKKFAVSVQIRPVP